MTDPDTPRDLAPNVPRDLSDAQLATWSNVARLQGPQARLEITCRPSSVDGEVIMVLHWQNGPRRLQQVVFADGFRGPVSGDERGRR